MFIIWLAGLAVLPLLLTWIFVIVGVFALYVCAGLAGTWTPSGIGMQACDPARLILARLIRSPYDVEHQL
jgi:hypothetical protein